MRQAKGETSYEGDSGLYWRDGREAGQASLSIPLGVASTPDGDVFNTLVVLRIQSGQARKG